jgi:methionyl-tRNA formyltransferase
MAERGLNILRSFIPRTRSYVAICATLRAGNKQALCCMARTSYAALRAWSAIVNHKQNAKPDMVATLGPSRHLNTLEMSKLKVFISGQKKFGEEILRLCIQKGCEIIGVCCPVDDKYIGALAKRYGIRIIPAGTLSADGMPEDVDLGITAHSFDYIGKRTRYVPKYGWIGYHPSLLPRHRGRSAIEWAIRMGDPITGGTVFWLNAGIDRGDIAYQDWCFIDSTLRAGEPAKAASTLWRDTLMPMGVRLICAALDDIAAGRIVRTPQDNRFSTFEPCTDVKDLYRPDLLMLPSGE